VERKGSGERNWSESRRSQDAGEKADLDDSRGWNGARRNLMLDSGCAKADCYGRRLEVEGTLPRRKEIAKGEEWLTIDLGGAAAELHLLYRRIPKISQKASVFQAFQ
jgi:hypothetical protein